MHKIKTFFFLLCIIRCNEGWAQHPDLDTFKIDSIFSLEGKFKRSKVSQGTDTLLEFSENNGARKLNAKNIRTIQKIKVNHLKYYRVTTQNIPADMHDVTTVSALLDYADLHLISMQLNANSDSGFVEFQQHRFSGWSQLPGEERKIIDLPYEGLSLLADAGTPWILGLLSLAEQKKIAFPYFALFSNVVKWKTYAVQGKETVTVSGKQYLCWKINAGHVGPPGYTSYQWYESKTGKFRKSELVKEGAAVKYVSELII